MLSSPRTTFAKGINPFQGLGALPHHHTETTPMQPPAKPARKNAKRLKDEDYSTPYQPPMIKLEDCDNEGVGELMEPAPKVASSMRYFDSAGLAICDDPLPTGRAIGVGKYDALFQQLGRGQAIKCPPEAVASVQHALRKWVKEQRVTGVLIKTCKDYGDGLGRVWLLAEPVKALKAA